MPAPIERTLVIIKPDGVQRGLIGEILHRYEQRGLRIAAMRLEVISRETAETHYEAHRDKPFFEPTVEYITSAPSVVLVLEGQHAISVVRCTNGATNAKDAAPGTIRGDFALTIGRNVVHGSDEEPGSAEREIALYFGDNVIDYARAADSWLDE